MNKTEITKTKNGKVQGVCNEGIQIFKGIPYAEPPIGGLRFRPPVAKKSWEDVLDASKYGSCTYQGYTQLEEWFGKLQPESEDCLTLNIWTPGTDNKKRPVMFWIHGGAFIMGSGVDPMYDGTELSKRGDIVVVTINYRLGAFGYLYIPDNCVNVGQLDQVMALKWVHENIEYFGGDPHNITIFGESAGGYSVLVLCAMPLAKGLFRRVIAQSAPFIDPSIDNKSTKKILRNLGLKKNDLEGALKIPPEKIIAAQNKYFEEDPTNILALRPLIDGKIITEHPLKAFQKGDLANIDFMIGTNLDEAKLFTALDPSLSKLNDAESKKALIGFLGRLGLEKDRIIAILETYKEARVGKYSTEPKEILSALITDVMFRIPTIRLLEAHSSNQSNTYNYIFTCCSPAFNGILGACHALELAFVFGTYNMPKIDEFAGKGPEVEKLSHKIMDAWISFARSGDPNADGNLEWSSYNKQNRTTMFIGNEWKVVYKAFDKETAAWDGLLTI